jgi:pimeloyl-ACP methyl ester carboxylesterase
MRSLVRTRKIAKRLLFVILIGFFLLNFVAFFHAYKFTHFDATIKHKTQDPKKLSIGKKIQTIFLGIDNPRPENKIVPDSAFQTIRLKSNKIIECWLIRSAAHKGTVVLFHGYGGEKSSMLDKAEIFLNLGYNTMLVDFMGSGGSEGNQTTIGYHEAIEVKTSFDFLDSSGEKNIILFGTSMGAAAIMKAMNDYHLKISAAILECPFGTLLETVQARFHTMHIPSFPMANLLVFWGGVENDFKGFQFKPEQYAKTITCPTLLLYGNLDDKVSRKEIDDIYMNLNGQKKYASYPLAGHEDYLIHYKDKWKNDVSTFLDEVKN